MTDKPKRLGRWKKGESGNPAGRKPGINGTTKLRESIAADLPDIISVMVRKAKDGDAQAARLLLERALPPMKPVEQPVTVTLPTNGGLTAQGVAILEAVAAGMIAPGQGAQLLAGLGTLARVMEVDELERRLTALEEAKHGNA